MREPLVVFTAGGQCQTCRHYLRGAELDIVRQLRLPDTCDHPQIAAVQQVSPEAAAVILPLLGAVSEWGGCPFYSRKPGVREPRHGDQLGDGYHEVIWHET